MGYLRFCSVNKKILDRNCVKITHDGELYTFSGDNDDYEPDIKYAHSARKEVVESYVKYLTSQIKLAKQYLDSKEQENV